MKLILKQASVAASTQPLAGPVQMTYIKLSKYCEATGDTPAAVHNRRKRGEWVDGVHCAVIEGRRLWINPIEVNRWFLSRA